MWAPAFLLGIAIPMAAQTPVIGVTSRLVEVGLSVVDNKGRHVPGLTRDDFELLDQGRPQAIASFTDLSAPLRPLRHPGPRPGVSTNRAADTLPPAPPVSIFLLDRTNTHPSGQAAGQAALGRLLSRQPPPGALAVYLLNEGLYPLVDLTADHAAALTAVARFTPAESSSHALSSLNPSRSGLPVDWMENLVRARENAWSMPHRRVRSTAEVLAALAETLRRIPGRKNLIWILDGCPLGPGPAALLSASNTAVYPVDAHGVRDLDPRVEDHMSSLGHLNSGAEFHADEAEFPPDSTFRLKMSAIAEATGGDVLTGSNDLAGQLRKAVDEGRGDYLLAFQPDSTHWDGAYHELRVVVRHPGWKVRARAGYVALDAALDAATAFRLAAESGLEATGLALEVSRAQPGDGGARLVMRVHVGGSVVSADEHGGGQARLRLAVVQLDGSGRRVDTLERLISMQLDGEQYAKARRIGLRLTTPVRPAHGARWLRMVLQDCATGAVGSVNVSL